MRRQASRCWVDVGGTTHTASSAPMARRLASRMRVAPSTDRFVLEVLGLARLEGAIE